MLARQLTKLCDIESSHGYLVDTNVKGKLIVIEGPDASGRSTQTTMLTSKLEADGHAVLNTGLRRSELISQGILEAKRNLVLDVLTATILLNGILLRRPLYSETIRSSFRSCNTCFMLLYKLSKLLLE
jgi:thymidylate kinase